MQLASIKRKKKSLVSSLESWTKLTGDKRKQYRALCAMEREALLKNPILPDREVKQNDNPPKHMDSR